MSWVGTKGRSKAELMEEHLVVIKVDKTDERMVNDKVGEMARMMVA